MTDSMECAQLSSADYTARVPEGIIADSVESNTTTEEVLARRYSRFNKKKEELVFEFTRDPALLHQYNMIHQEQVRLVHNAHNFKSLDIEPNHKGHVLVVRQGKLCIGGARIAFRTPRSTDPLPVEADGFNLREHFPCLEHKQMRYGQLFGLSLLPQFRGGDVTRDVFRHLYRKVVALDLDMVFVISPVHNARAYRQYCVAMGLKDIQIHRDFNLPLHDSWEEIKICLTSGIIDKTNIKPEKNTDISADLHTEVL